ncbi:unnamed protein product [Pleuronectes platessa]|uniref:Uncharacterized protein n=1 Tax=Pleuronectes platessa TaxID=8262 RepID=A0A9N7VG27_PLEPL|nr:unnamed protein product [Pleuronectes platessa]
MYELHPPGSSKHMDRVSHQHSTHLAISSVQTEAEEPAPPHGNPSLVQSHVSESEVNDQCVYACTCVCVTVTRTWVSLLRDLAGDLHLGQAEQRDRPTAS